MPPITELRRVLARFEGTEGLGVELIYDTDGRLGADEDGCGWPRYWLRAGGRTLLGPWEDEEDALEEAGRRYGAGPRAGSGSGAGGVTGSSGGAAASAESVASMRARRRS